MSLTFHEVSILTIIIIIIISGGGGGGGDSNIKGLFEIVVTIVVQSAFCLEMH
jgi:hypothetical protein